MADADFTSHALEGWSRIRPDLDLEPQAAVQRLIRAGRLAYARLEAVSAAAGIRVRGDYEVLAALRRGDPSSLTPIQLASQLRISGAGLTGRLDRLENRDLLRRDPHPDDRRSYHVVLTPAGRAVVDETFEASLKAQAELLATLTSQERFMLATLLQRLLLAMGDAPPG